MRIKPVILCGGSGSRLWPLSTPDHPKQFLSLTDTESMISVTARRLGDIEHASLSFDPTLVIGSQKHERLLRKQLPNAALILEPFGRNSAPAVAAACLASEPDEVLLILPADHHIEDVAAFASVIATGHQAASEGAIVTFGITPSHPSVDYGYIAFEPGPGPVHRVQEFVEKPKQDLARHYFESGHYLWNAGIFLFRVQTMLDAFQRHAPNLLDAVSAALPTGDKQVRNLRAKSFAKATSISIDCAIMEHETDLAVIPVDMGWSDVGDFHALWALFAKSDGDNITAGPTRHVDSEGLYVRSEGPAVFTSGVKDLVIVANDDNVLVAPRGDAQTVKSLMAVSTLPHISPPVAKRAAGLLKDALHTWSMIAWDADKGGFIERCDLAGQPDVNADRRVRVQARQIFSFARAASAGFMDPSTALPLVVKGLEYLDTTCRHAQGGWGHIINRQGDWVNQTQDLYDHAFVMLAGAAAFEITGDAQALKMSTGALQFIDGHLCDTEHGGYFENRQDRKTRRANPHMHLLETFLELYRVTDNLGYLTRASHLVALFEARFFDPVSNTVRETLADDWSPLGAPDGAVTEPGHAYEWVTLLQIHDRLTKRDTRSWRNRLLKAADHMGHNPRTGLVYNQVSASGKTIQSGSRLWPQLERFRARLSLPGHTAAEQADTLFATIEARYFATMPKGLWIDEISATGKPLSTHVPASMLYHLVTAFGAVGEVD